MIVNKTKHLSCMLRVTDKHSQYQDSNMPSAHYEGSLLATNDTVALVGYTLKVVIFETRRRCSRKRSKSPYTGLSYRPKIPA